MKDKFYIHIAGIDGDSTLGDEVEGTWTITTNSRYAGWNTDGGYPGYGLPKELAQWICDRLNESNEECPYKTDCDDTWIKKK